MRGAWPEKDDIRALTILLPRFQAPGYEPIRKWGGGETVEGGVTMPWPDYDHAIGEFIEVASRPCWSDYEYDPLVAARMLEDTALVARASLAQIKTMLTYCVRGERFCDGHIGALIREGKLQALLTRLQAFLDKSP